MIYHSNLLMRNKHTQHMCRKILLPIPNPLERPRSGPQSIVRKQADHLEGFPVG